MSETITVTSESPIAEPGKIDLGRTIGETEIRNLPLVSRNPYNFAFLQANVTGYENNEFGVPRINANGSQMHTNYQIDGNTNTEKDRAGLRLLPMSEVLVREVKVITNGFAPEFGQTTGWSTTRSRRRAPTTFTVRRASASSATPMSSQAVLPGADRAQARHRGRTTSPPRSAARSRRTSGTSSARTSTSIAACHRRPGHHGRRPRMPQALGITLPASGVIPAHQKVNFAFGKTDYQLSPGSLLSVRYFGFKNFSPSNIGGGLTTTDRATDFTDRMDSTSAQLVSTHRREHAERAARAVRAAPPVPHAGHVGGRPGDHGDRQRELRRRAHRRRQLGRLRLQPGHHARSSTTSAWIRGKHAFKAGIDAQWIGDERVRGELFLYTFPTIAATSRRRAAPTRSATRLPAAARRPHGRATIPASTACSSQDDWQIAPRLKLLYGVRYDLFDVPPARPFAANPYSQNFAIDKNNFGPRAGVSWSVDNRPRPVVRASTGLMYEPPLLDFYDNAILNNGDPTSYNVGPVAADRGGRAGVPGQPGDAAARFVLPGRASPRSIRTSRRSRRG